MSAKGRIIARYRQDVIDSERWQMVHYVRDKQKELREGVTTARQGASGDASWLQDMEKLLKWNGRSLKCAYECASMLLLGTEAYAGPEAIKTSYLKVEKWFETKRGRYLRLDDDFIEKLGMQHRRDEKQGRKWVPIYDLKP